MADLPVVLLTTFVILLLSYFYWQWRTKQKNLTDQSRNRPLVSRDDMLKHRRKRFELKADDDASSVVQKQGSTKPKDESVKKDLEETGEDKEGKTLEDSTTPENIEINATSLPGSLNSDSMQVLQPETSTNEGDENKGAGAKTSPAEAKSDNSRKWVTLSVSDSDNKSEPVTRPLTSLDELRAWTEGFDELNVSSVSLRRVGNDLERRPRTIVCHDMKGGYVQDRFVQGYPSANCYRIYHWQYIDIFIYFSHNFITIPPPCWTNAAHKHGVLVLGTFITEWHDGAARCAEIFKDQFSYKQVADQLVSIAMYYGFDGWLMNIENPIQPAQMNNLEDFIKYLTEKMHEAIPGSLIIWYDSVTYKGELMWQNKLNAENRVFFDVSDGIFLNYGWSQTDLALSHRAAGPGRKYDVYVGVDVFGRDVYGGGGWNTNKATHVIKENDLSMALFAPGWVYEKYESTFKASQDKFWTLIAPDCSTHAMGPCLPFVTSFCQGYGEKFFNHGKVVYDKPWTHLSAQELQPSFVQQVYTLGTSSGVLVTQVDHQIQDSYRGGGCLKLEGSTKLTTTSCKAVVRLFKTDLQLPSTVLISLTIKVESSNPPDVALQLHVDKNPNYIMLCPAPEDNAPDSDKVDSLNEALLQRYGVRRSDTIDSTRMASVSVGQEHYRSFAPVTGEYHKRLAEMSCNEQDFDEWRTRYYLLAEKYLKGSHIKEIRLVLINKTTSEKSGESSLTPFQLYLGEVKIIDAVFLRKSIPTVTSLKCLESQIKSHIVDSKTLAITLTLSWSYDSRNTEPWDRFEIYHVTVDGSTVFLGLAYAMAYVVCDLALPRPRKEARFIVRAIGCNRRKQELKDSSAITVHW